MRQIISTSTDESTSVQHPSEPFGFCEIKGRRHSMEDALVWAALPDDALESEKIKLTPEELRHRLWTTDVVLDELCQNRGFFEYKFDGGSTASTVVYDGNGNLLIATLGDAYTFAAVYSQIGEPLGVLQLNKIIHTPEQALECTRIKAMGGKIRDGRINGINISRSIGDVSSRKSGMIADPSIDIVSLENIRTHLNIDVQNIGSIKIITSCDGFTEPADYDGVRANSDSMLEKHQDYLLGFLKEIHTKQPQNNEVALARDLVFKAYCAGSGDNISIAVHTLSYHELALKKAFFMSVYDGHGDEDVAHFAAQSAVNLFVSLCQLPKAVYAAYKHSVFHNSSRFNRDHPYAQIEARTGPIGDIERASYKATDEDLLIFEDINDTIDKWKFLMKIKLFYYCQRVLASKTSLETTAQSIRYTDICCFFTRSRSINRTIHYKMALSLFCMVETIGTWPEAEEFLGDIAINKLRKTLRRELSIPVNHQYRGLRFSQLGDIISTGRDNIHKSHNHDVAEGVELSLLTPLFS